MGALFGGLRWFAVTVLLLMGISLSAVAPVAAAGEPSTVTQGELAVRLVTELGLEKGLPEKPQPADYLAVLGGRRHYRFEAEDVYDAEGDSVSVKNYPLCGPFTGKGWVCGLAVSTTVRFAVFLPRAGEYRLKVSSRGDGQLWRAGGEEFRVSTGGALREAVAGSVSLKAGPQVISVQLPPEGGVDWIALEADDLPALEPLEGWRFEAPLTWGTMAEVLAPLLGLEQKMPVDKAGSPHPVAVHAAANLPDGVTTTTATFLGPFTPPKWVRAGSGGAVIEVPLVIEAAGMYELRVRLLGDPVVIDFDGRRSERPGKPFLVWHNLGIMRLREGRHLLTLTLPPLGGADVVEILKHKSSPADYLEIIGLKGTPQATVTRAAYEEALKVVLSRFRVAK
ncbi:hypothetical protein [Geobacter sp.]|uniref:hypothetical protein n=1 Tax=Geobacter sp. TaxID=46610 RepID=UPI00262D225A|nr:hypothetical protein [Geobacter sp.]